MDKAVWQACLATQGEWKKTTLNPLNQDSVPVTPGVYAVCARPAVPKGVFEHVYNIIYIGQAKGEGGLRNRFLAHCNRPKLQMKLAKDCFKHPLDYWFQELEAHEVAGEESRLIECLGPIVNLVGGVIEARIGKARPA